MAPKPCIHGYNGDANSGAYAASSSRNATTAGLISATTMIWKAMASFAISGIGTNAMSASSTTSVSVIEVTGVPKRWLIVERDGGANLSRLIANG